MELSAVHGAEVTHNQPPTIQPSRLYWVLSLLPSIILAIPRWIGRKIEQIKIDRNDHAQWLYMMDHPEIYPVCYGRVAEVTDQPPPAEFSALPVQFQELTVETAQSMGQLLGRFYA